MARSVEYTESLTELIRDFASAQVIELGDSMRADVSTAGSATLPTTDTDFVLTEEELTPRFKQAFLQVLSLRACIDQYGYDSVAVNHTKKASILELSASWISQQWRTAAEAVVAARKFLMARCGIRRNDDLRNQLILLPLAILLSDDDISAIPGTLDKLEYWYWCSVLTGRYREQQNAQCIDDLKALYRWLSDDIDNPFAGAEQKVLNDPEYSSEEALLERGSDSRVATDVGNYLPQYVLSKMPIDFLKTDMRLRTWEVARDLHLHHIVPLGSVATLQESASILRKDRDSVFNSPLNLTYIASETNQELKSLPVASYMTDVDDAVRAAHYLPVDLDGYSPREAENMESVCRRILSERHKAIRMELKNDLTNLRGS